MPLLSTRGGQPILLKLRKPVSQDFITGFIKIIDFEENRELSAKEGELRSKGSGHDKLLDSIIQSRCLTKDQDRKDLPKDKLASCKTNKLKNLVAKDEYADTQHTQKTDQSKYSRKASRVRKSISSSNNRKGTKEEATKEEKKDKDPKAEEEIDKPWISYLRNLRIPMM